MGLGSIWHWIILLAVVLVLFGGNKLRNLGGDIGASIKGFKDAMKDQDKNKDQSSEVKPIETNQTKSSSKEEDDNSTK